uniref:Calponin-homology (CH) domain-containing protein n=1 Tax=Hippocampus comes TaxID=109280 RepID=A0A3Q2Y219_HIPCM
MKRLRDEQESVQKRTFTKWINSHLAKRVPPLVVTDLFEDIKDGVKLLALLEVLSGQKLVIAYRLIFKELIKLVNINSTDIVDGRPSIVLGLVWTIILYFQIEELTCGLPEIQPPSGSSSSLNGSASSADNASPPVKRKPLPPVQGSARKALLRWVQQTATKRLGIEVKDFGPSWRTGLAFLAIIHALQPNLVDMERSRKNRNRENLQEAFLLAETQLGIAQLLDPEDVDVDKPDEKSIMTYVAQFLKHHPDGERGTSEGRAAEEEEVEEVNSCHGDLIFFSRPLSFPPNVNRGVLHLKPKCITLFKSLRVQLEMRRKHMEDCLKSTHCQDFHVLFISSYLKLLDWHLLLDTSLPAPLDVLGAWLHHTEGALRQDGSAQQADQTVSKALQRHKVDQQCSHKRVENRDQCPESAKYSVMHFQNHRKPAP